jgi:prolyl-tRNA synthetase
MLNQWCNVVRWEMRTRLFLRTSEFLWQEGHTAHATREEAEEETLKILEVYRSFVEDFLAIPLVVGRKSAAERFPGAVETYAIEGMMGDGRALQCGTSHFLGQNFAKAFETRYLDENNQLQLVWQTSWGVSTRLLGAIIMAHGDDQGLRIPPTVAATQVVVVPIWRKADEGDNVLAAAKAALQALERAGIRVRLDAREGLTPGFKFNDWEMRGVPIRIEIGPRDVASGEAVLARRDMKGPEAKSKASLASIAESAKSVLGEIQRSLFAQAKAARDATTREHSDYSALREQMAGEGGSGFALTYWCGNPTCEAKIREDTKATCRAIPLNQQIVTGKCIVCGQSAAERAYFAKAY